MRTSRDRLESTPYLRLAKGCQSVKVFSSAAPEKKIEKSLKIQKKLEGETLWNFSTSILSQRSKNIEGGPFG